jgi:hypothetical protein
MAEGAMKGGDIREAGAVGGVRERCPVPEGFGGDEEPDPAPVGAQRDTDLVPEQVGHPAGREPDGGGQHGKGRVGVVGEEVEQPATAGCRSVGGPGQRDDRRRQHGQEDGGAALGLIPDQCWSRVAVRVPATISPIRTREVASAVAASSVIPSKTSPAASAKIGLKWSKAQAVVEAVRVSDAPDGAQVLDRAVLRRELDAQRGHSPRYRRTRGSPAGFRPRRLLPLR